MQFSTGLHHCSVIPNTHEYWIAALHVCNWMKLSIWNECMHICMVLVPSTCFCYLIPVPNSIPGLVRLAGLSWNWYFLSLLRICPVLCFMASLAGFAAAPRSGFDLLSVVWSFKLSPEMILFCLMQISLDCPKHFKTVFVCTGNHYASVRVQR